MDCRKSRIGVVLLLTTALALSPLTVSYSQAYVIGPGDVLAIGVWGFENLSAEVEVLPDGTVALPLIGIVRVAGLSLAQVREELTKRYAAFIKNPQVTVIVKKRGTISVAVVGEVVNPGAVALPRGARVLDAIASAGGVTEFASLDEAQIIRSTQAVIPLNLQAILKGDQQANVELQPGDVIVIPRDRTNLVFVAGQVNKPGLVPLRQAPSLLEALVQAGGLTEKASLTEGRIIRKSGEIIPLDLEALLLRGDLSKNIPLKAGDVIFIPEGTYQIYVLGAVNNPGAFKVRGEVTALEALNLAGGINRSRATGKGRIIRRVTSGAQAGAPATESSVVTLNLEQLLRRADLGQNVTLRPGDILYVEEVGLPSMFEVILTILSGLKNLVSIFR